MSLSASEINAVIDEGFERFDTPRFTIITNDGATTGIWSGHGTDMVNGEEDVWLYDDGHDHNFAYREIENISIEETTSVS